ncbi:MAG: hypothetical protein A3F41_06765 [Coxiella sp. RIFCSPHIGHO2_12_FULL_44_14]|nr:MAG: hypothetical protein A3F41_06765 [Coxiella sp. RIFCSPHIGHO2_12_FULL_44_14]
MKKEFYLDLCTSAFYQIAWHNKHKSLEQFYEVRSQILQLSKQERFMILNLAVATLRRVPKVSVGAKRKQSETKSVKI